jgi:hypothetical protein
LIEIAKELRNIIGTSPKVEPSFSEEAKLSDSAHIGAIIRTSGRGATLIGVIVMSIGRRTVHWTRHRDGVREKLL